MIVYICARLFAWLYGFAWPLGHAPNGDNIGAGLAMLSAMTFPFEIYSIIMLVCLNMKRGGK